MKAPAFLVAFLACVVASCVVVPTSTGKHAWAIANKAEMFEIRDPNTGVVIAAATNLDQVQGTKHITQGVATVTGLISAAAVTAQEIAAKQAVDLGAQETTRHATTVAGATEAARLETVGGAVPALVNPEAGNVGIVAPLLKP